MQDPQRQFATYFHAVCVEISRRKKANSGQIQALIGLESSQSIDRFEDGRTFPTQNLDGFAAAYAHLDGIDPRDLYLRAITLWKTEGKPPLIAEDRKTTTTAAPDPFSFEALIEAIRLAEDADARRHARSKQQPAQDAEQPNATRRKRAGGE